MGKAKLKALKSSGGSIPSDALNEQHNKHVVFGDDPVTDLQPVISSQQTTSSILSSSSTTKAITDEKPVEIKQSSTDVFKLQSEIEGLFSSRKQSKRKRKLQQAFLAPHLAPTVDHYLDTVVLNDLAASKADQNDATDDEDEEDQQHNPRDDELEHRSSSSRRIGRLMVTTLVEKGMHEFQMNSEAKRFIEEREKSAPRVKYSTYSKRRRPVPAKQFAIGR